MPGPGGGAGGFPELFTKPVVEAVMRFSLIIGACLTYYVTCYESINNFPLTTSMCWSVMTFCGVNIMHTLYQSVQHLDNTPFPP